jgi:glycosyltransferase involved in cell wall biosynthesis
MAKLRIAILVPTYNNATTLGTVLDALTDYHPHVIVVNDGSTDGTAQLLDGFPGLHRVEYRQNKGKGIALREGFAYALKQGYDYVITMDADGQHFASDIAVFLDRLDEEKDALMIGARNLQQENMPGKNTFANKFSNFWFYVETGIKAPDTQSGYRLYPLYLMQDMRFWCTKYEFEIEVLVRCAWRGIKIDWVPIQVYYPPAAERVSHFRPLRDFSRISVLNTILVLITFLYIKPRDFFRFLIKGDNWKKMWHEQLLNKQESNWKKALSIGLGIFMGIIPLWGFQMMIAILLSVLFRLNKVLVIIAANISIPPMIPLIIFFSLQTGRMWVGKDATGIIFSRNLSMQDIHDNLVQYIYGSVTLAVLAGLFAVLCSYVLLMIFRKEKESYEL